MTRQYQGVVTHLENDLTNMLVWVWYGDHQLGLVMGKIFRIVMKYYFYSFMNRFILYLVRKAKLISDMENIFPRVVNGWLLTYKVTKCFNMHHMKFKAKNMSKNPQLE